ncbi:hypothetical protein KFU94_40240 [Chloroflexi bacterium TSY]|nr:hypothetical protein [Chloroflexi bacterium TSY]
MINTAMISNAPQRPTFGSLFDSFKHIEHHVALWLYMFIVFGHFSEHGLQIYQVYVMGWLPKEAGGLLGLWFPELAQAEVLHFVYNGFQLGGIIFLYAGFRGSAKIWWTMALGAQCWHMFEHVLLQIQWLTGQYLFGAAEQMGIGQLFLPRVELHFLYNMIVFIPTMIGTYLYFRQLDRE